MDLLNHIQYLILNVIYVKLEVVVLDLSIFGFPGPNVIGECILYYINSLHV